MKQVENTRELETLRYALSKVPVHFLGIGVQVRLERAYYTTIMGVYEVYLSYDMYALHGVVFLHEPDMGLYLDYQSVLLVVQKCIEAALQNYNATSDPRYRGM